MNVAVISERARRVELKRKRLPGVNIAGIPPGRIGRRRVCDGIGVGPSDRGAGRDRDRLRLKCEIRNRHRIASGCTLIERARSRRVTASAARGEHQSDADPGQIRKILHFSSPSKDHPRSCL